MDDAVLVRELQAEADLLDDLEALEQRQRRRHRQPLGERASAQPLHRDEGRLVVPGDVVDGGQMPVTQLSDRPRLTQELLSSRPILRHVGQQQLHRDLPRVVRIGRFVDDAGCALADPGVQLIAAGRRKRRRHRRMLPLDAVPPRRISRLSITS